MRKSGDSRESESSEKAPGRGTLTSPASPAAPSGLEPGKRTAVEAVQRKAEGNNKAADPVGVAQRGVAGTGGSLPYLQQIQSSFGRHDVSGVKAHQGGAAAEASGALGARAYAVGNSVAFKGSPDLHTAAHEAAHVVQNRGGVSLKGAIDGGSGDAHEQHADAVADTVVAGKSAEGLLDKGAGGGGGATVQRIGGEKAAGPAGPAPAERAPAGLTGALMLQITPEWAAAIAAASKGPGRDEELKAILLGAFEANWFKAKDCLLFDRWPTPKTAPDRPTHAAQGELMQALVNMRSRICDGIAVTTQAELPARLKQEAAVAKAAPKPAPDAPASIEKQADQFHAEANDANITPAQHTTFMPPAGAQKKTSDIDVSTGGKNTEIAVKLYNEIFRRELRVVFDPATVFDYNVYSSDWIHKANFKNENMVAATEIDPATKVAKVGAVEKQVPTRVTPQPEHIIAGAAGGKEADTAANAALQADRAKILDETALLHIRRNCHGPDWAQYTKGRIDAEPDEAAKRALRVKLAAVDLKYKTFAAEVAARSSTVATQMAATLAAFDRASDWGAKNKEFQEEAVHTRASNELYQEKLRAVKALRLQYAELAAKPTKSEADIEELSRIAKQVTAALGDAFFFANEVYASEGAVLHTVVGIQGATNDAKKFGIAKIDVVLTPDHYMQSFHENVGDSLHQLEHYKQDEAYAIYRAGKYIDRMIQAADSLCGKEEAVKHPKYIALATLATKATAIKATDAGDDPVEIKKKFPEASQTSIATLKSSVINFGADIPEVAKKVEEKKTAAAATGKPKTPAQRPVEPKPASFETSTKVTAPIKIALDSLRASVEAADDKSKKGT